MIQSNVPEPEHGKASPPVIVDRADLSLTTDFKVVLVLVTSATLLSFCVVGIFALILTQVIAVCMTIAFSGLVIILVRFYTKHTRRVMRHTPSERYAHRVKEGYRYGIIGGVIMILYLGFLAAEGYWLGVMSGSAIAVFCIAVLGAATVIMLLLLKIQNYQPRLFCPYLDCGKFIEFFPHRNCASCGNQIVGPLLAECCFCGEYPTTLACPHCKLPIRLGDKHDPRHVDTITSRLAGPVNSDVEHGELTKQILTVKLQRELVAEMSALENLKKSKEPCDWFQKQIERAVESTKLEYQKEQALELLGRTWIQEVEQGPLDDEEKKRAVSRIHDRINSAKMENS